jgi:hypothetical protein
MPIETRQHAQLHGLARRPTQFGCDRAPRFRGGRSGGAKLDCVAGLERETSPAARAFMDFLSLAFTGGGQSLTE